MRRLFSGSPEEDNRAVLAALLPAGLRVEAEAGLLFLFLVALQAVFDEKGADSGFEKGGAVGRSSREFGGATEQHEYDD